GYSFSSWDKAVPATFDAASDTFTAQWTAHTYTIVFNANGGEGTMDNLSMTYDVSADLTANTFTKTNYALKGWALSVDGEIEYANKQEVKNLTAVNEADITLYAVWSNTGILANGNMLIAGVEYSKTSMKQVLSESTAITCDQSNGVFPTARGSVTLGKYAIGKYEVTQQLYKAVMGSNPSSFERSTRLDTGETNYLLRPVEQVSWYDAIVFCNKVSLMMGKTRCYKLSDGTYPEDLSTIPSTNNKKWDNAICDWTADGYRLPTECEWECAARGGTYSAGTPWTYPYSGSDMPQLFAWYNTNSSSHTWEVGLKYPNSLGLYDMSGNVWEMCWDNYNTAAIDGSTPETGPAINSSAPYFYRRLRGGSWFHIGSFSTVSKRSESNPYERSDTRGFRLACSGE
ncbi:MAG: SUMF1/EgtB/PvdO family nonheme iron enzyme, partial [Spirochaetales bacterium]|nr:SUMF1/EgtB/PvdO family nonheme iron enzyme [Spirochaetales bacterium]